MTLKPKIPSWTQEQLKEAMEAVIKQKMRFTQASTRYGIPKGTLYDNILGKSNRMHILDEFLLTPSEELELLEYCCSLSIAPYNRKTNRSLLSVLRFVETLHSVRNAGFVFDELTGYRWWWAFCKRHNINSLYYENNSKHNNNNNNNNLNSNNNYLKCKKSLP